MARVAPAVAAPLPLTPHYAIPGSPKGTFPASHKAGSSSQKTLAVPGGHSSSVAKLPGIHSRPSSSSSRPSSTGPSATPSPSRSPLGRVVSAPLFHARALAELRRSNARWAEAFDGVDEDRDGSVDFAEAVRAFKRILGVAEDNQVPMRTLKKEFHLCGETGGDKLDFEKFHSLVKVVSTHMTEHPNWEDLDAKDEMEEMEREKRQLQLKRNAAQDLFNILGVQKTQDVVQMEARKNQAVRRAAGFADVGNAVLGQARVVRRVRMLQEQAKRATVSETKNALAAVGGEEGRGGGCRWDDPVFKRIATIDLASDIRELTYKGYGSACFSLRFSPCGSRLAGAYFDGCVRVFDSGTATQTLTLNMARPNATGLITGKMDANAADALRMPEGDAVTNLRWLPSSRKFLLALVDIAGNIGLWDLTRGRPPRLVSRTPGTGELAALTFTSDRSRLIVAGGERVVKTYDYSEGASELQLVQTTGGNASALGKTSGHNSKVVALCSDPASPDVVLSGGLDRRVLMWDLRANQRPVGAIKGAELAGDSIDLSEDGKTLLAASHRSNDVIQLFDLRQIGASQPVEASSSFSWAGERAQEGVAPPKPEFSCMAFSASWDSKNKIIAVAGEKEPLGQVYRRRVDDSALDVLGAVRCRGSGTLFASTVSEDGKRAAFGSSEGYVQFLNL